VKRLIVARPSHPGSHITNASREITGLAVLSSDALSSVAYATKKSCACSLVGGHRGDEPRHSRSAPVIAAVMIVVVFSYRQTIHAYPSGGGAYIVAKDNLGRMPSLIAAASLLIDYVLTVSVSIAAGVAAITSAFPQWQPHTVALCLGFVVMLMLGNLRGIRESGQLFAGPTYFFIGSILAMIAVGGARVLHRHVAAGATASAPACCGDDAAAGVRAADRLLQRVHRAHRRRGGIKRGSRLPAAREPERRRHPRRDGGPRDHDVSRYHPAGARYAIMPNDVETVVSQIARATFDGRGWPYYAVQVATMAILVLAANTAYADFPRLASIMARDRFLPRQFMNQGDRLAFSNGILILSVLASVLLVVFEGDTHALIPLYMIGVFVSFTLSQAGW
jgi:amino acid transporter